MLLERNGYDICRIVWSTLIERLICSRSLYLWLPRQIEPLIDLFILPQLIYFGLNLLQLSKLLYKQLLLPLDLSNATQPGHFLLQALLSELYSRHSGDYFFLRIYFVRVNLLVGRVRVQGWVLSHVVVDVVVFFDVLEVVHIPKVLVVKQLLGGQTRLGGYRLIHTKTLATFESSSAPERLWAFLHQWNVTYWVTETFVWGGCQTYAAIQDTLALDGVSALAS